MDTTKFIKYFLGLGNKAKEAITQFAQNMKQEVHETGEASSYVAKYMRGEELTEEENHAIKQQFFDILKMLGIGVPFAVIPGASILMPILLKLADKYKINLMPSSFTKKKNDNLNEAKVNRTKLYHGSDYKFDKFEIKLVEGALEQEGPGIYLTTSEDDARRYGKYLYTVEWKYSRLLPYKQMSETQLRQYGKAKTAITRAPDYKDTLTNWDENTSRALQIATDNFYEYSSSLKDLYLSIWADFYKNNPVEFCEVMNYWIGYDGMLLERQNGVSHAIAYNVDKIKILNVEERTVTESIMNELKASTPYFNPKVKKLQEYIDNEESFKFKQLNPNIKETMFDITQLIPQIKNWEENNYNMNQKDKNKVDNLVNGQFDLPPVIIERYTESGGWKIIDGWHRIAAALRKGEKNIKAFVKDRVRLQEQVYTVYHGTRERFDKFDVRQGAQGLGWFSDSKEEIMNGNAGASSSKVILTCKISIKNPAGWDEYEKYGIGQLKNLGYDGIILPNGDGTNNYVVFKNSQVKILKEDINLDIDKGDTILTGRFKNHKIEVKDIGEDEHGMPTVNGKQITKIRIPKIEEPLIEKILREGNNNI